MHNENAMLRFANEGKKPDLKTEASFVLFSSAKVLREFRETFAEEFCFDWRSGLPTLCISAMISLQNNS